MSERLFDSTNDYNEEAGRKNMENLERIQKSDESEVLAIYCAAVFLKRVMTDAIRNTVPEKGTVVETSHSERQKVRTTNIGTMQGMAVMRMSQLAGNAGVTLDAWIQEQYNKRKNDPVWKKRVRELIKTF